MVWSVLDSKLDFVTTLSGRDYLSRVCRVSHSRLPKRGNKPPDANNVRHVAYHTPGTYGRYIGLSKYQGNKFTHCVVD